MRCNIDVGFVILSTDVTDVTDETGTHFSNRSEGFAIVCACACLSVRRAGYRFRYRTRLRVLLSKVACRGAVVA